MRELFVLNDISCNTELSDEDLELSYTYRFLNLKNGKDMLIDIRRLEEFDYNKYTIFHLIGKYKAKTVKSIITQHLLNDPSLFSEIE